jgi:hypothetical protein
LIGGNRLVLGLISCHCEGAESQHPTAQLKSKIHPMLLLVALMISAGAAILREGGE